MNMLQKRKADGIRRWIFRGMYAAGVLLLVIPELVAIFNNLEGDTISENVWHVLDVLGNSDYHAFALPAAFIFVAGSALWLVVHFFRRVWRKL